MPRRTSRLGSTKPGVHLVDSKTSGSLSSIALRLLRIYNSNVKSVLKYGSECWRIVRRDINKVNAFHNSCLRNIFCPNKISNNDLYQKTGCTSIDLYRSKYLKRRIVHSYGDPGSFNPAAITNKEAHRIYSNMNKEAGSSHATGV